MPKRVLLSVALLTAGLAVAQDRPNLLPNGGCEGAPYTQAARPGSKAEVGGTLAAGWRATSGGRWST
jgi:hypothetical protein